MGSIVSILYAVAVVLVVLWILGLVLHILGGAIHILLVLAVIVVLYNFITGRRRAM